MFGIGAMELVVILVLALIIFGPGKLPEVGKAIGRGVREFKKATSEVMDDDEPDTTSARHAVAPPDGSGTHGGAAGSAAQAAPTVRNPTADDDTVDGGQPRGG